MSGRSEIVCIFTFILSIIIIFMIRFMVIEKEMANFALDNSKDKMIMQTKKYD